MSSLVGAGDVERFRSLITGRFGLDFDDGKLGHLAEVLRRRIDETGDSPAAYLRRLDSQGDARVELRALAPELTVSETYFFRGADQLRAFQEAAVPERLRARAPSRSLRILSAGCASGEEPYTLAMLLRDRTQGPEPIEVSIHGLDLNAGMLGKARRARYATWALRETPPEASARWFREDGRELVLDPAVRDMVTFEERNLAEDDPAFWRPEVLDIVFCRNVLMYFAPEKARAVVAHFARSLVPGGFLFLGSAENLRGLSQDFHLCHTHGAFYYRAKGGAHEEPSLPRSAPVALDDHASWAETIRLASDRVSALTTRTEPRAVPSADRRVSRAWDLGSAIELVGRERFSEARAALGALPEESAGDPDVLLLSAVLFTHGGDLAEAEKVCAALLARDEMSAGAHYLLALCREDSGDRKGALEHDRLAIHLDPGFAMPRLHLGLLARRAGDHEAARQDLGQALALLGREDASRLLLFGGGFSRDALVALCRAELVSCGGVP